MQNTRRATNAFSDHTEQARARILAAGCAVMFVLGIQYIWSSFSIPLSEYNPEWSPSDYSLCFTLVIVFATLSVFIASLLNNRIGRQTLMLGGAAMMFSGVMLLSCLQFSKTLMPAYIGFGLMAGSGTGIIYFIVMDILPKWYPNRSGFATGVAQTAIGIGTFGMSLIVVKLMERFDIFSVFRGLAVCIAIILTICSFGIKPPPQEPAAVKEKTSLAPRPGLRRKQMLRTRSFWAFIIWSMLNQAVALAVLNRAANIFAFYQAPAMLGMIVVVVNGLSRTAVGALVDRLGAMKSMLALSVFTTLICLLLTLSDVFDVKLGVLVGTLLTGIVGGGNTVYKLPAVRELYGERCVSENYAVSNLCVIVSSLIGSYCTGLLQDVSSGYLSTFIAMLAASLVCIALAYITKHLHGRESGSATAFTAQAAVFKDLRNDMNDIEY